MAKGKTQSRRPVKARGTIPAPKVAPTRRRIAWYKRRVVQIGGSILVVGAIALITWNVLKNRSESRDLQRQISRFESRINTLQSSAGTVLQEMNNSPGQFQGGALSSEDFIKQIDAWLTHFRRVDESLRTATVPPQLQDARALLVNGNIIYIDAAKALRDAVGAADPTHRDILINNARSLLTHATSVYGMGQRELQKVKRQVGLIGDEPDQLIDQPPILPNEEVAPPPAPVPTEPPPPQESPAAEQSPALEESPTG